MTDKRKKIYLKAYLCKNLGDDMFVRCIAERYPDVLFKIAVSSEQADTFKNLSNITNISTFQYFVDRVSNKFFGKQMFKRYIEKNSDATVHIGGSIFIEPEYFVPPKKIDLNPKLYIIGCNFGPHKTEAYRNFIYSRLQKATDVCFRDKYSYNEFSDIDHVRLAPDVLFGYPDYPVSQKGNGVGISVIDLTVRPELKNMAEKYYRNIAEVVDQLIRNEVPVKLLSFCSTEGDMNAIKKIIEYAETSGVEICEYDGNIDGMLTAINSCEYIMASRFHAMIIGWVLSKKVLPVIYSNKQLNVIRDVDFKGKYWDLREFKNYTSKQLMCDLIQSASLDRVDKLIINSEIQFEKLDGYLNGVNKDKSSKIK